VVVQVVDGSDSPRAAAVRLFRFVRDEILYAFGPWNIPASAVLARRNGTCANKNNLLIALLRGAGIPAGYGILRVNAQEYFGSIAPPFFKHLASPFSTHIYAAALLDGRWVKCDASTDRQIAEKTARFCAQTRLLDWDGASDTLDFLDPDHIYADLGLRASVDDLLDKPPRNSTPATVTLLNDYIRFIRSNPPFRSAEQLIEAYRSQLAPERHLQP
jgi:hypothetical protein